MGAITGTLDPALVRGARGLLGWSQDELAKRAGVSRPTVTHYERGSRMPIPVVAQAVRAALEAGGVEFIPDGTASAAGRGMGLRMRLRGARPEPDGGEDPGSPEAP